MSVLYSSFLLSGINNELQTALRKRSEKVHEKGERDMKTTEMEYTEDITRRHEDMKFIFQC